MKKAQVAGHFASDFAIVCEWLWLRVVLAAGGCLRVVGELAGDLVGDEQLHIHGHGKGGHHGETERLWRFYSCDYGGDLPRGAFEASLPAARRLVRWLCHGCEPARHAKRDERASYGRALCAALECLAEYGEGQVGGLTLGDFRVTHYEAAETSGRSLAIRAALDELSGTGLAFCGVC